MPAESHSSRRWPLVIVAVAVVAAGTWLGMAGCSGEAPPQDPVARGKMIYALNCIVCHNADPALPGTLGPEVAGSSRELLEARVLRREYPPGYVAKRSTDSMVPMPWLKDSIDDLAAYLQPLRPADGAAPPDSTPEPQRQAEPVKR